MENFQELSGIDISEYYYDLEENRIAAYPLENRDQSALLYAVKFPFEKKNFSDLPSLLPLNTLMISNDTKVIPARLHFKKKSGAHIEIFLLNPISGNAFQEEMIRKESSRWKVLIGNASKWKKGELDLELNFEKEQVFLSAIRLSHDEVKFTWSNSNLSFAEILDIVGKVPLPPYIKRAAETSDKKRYQTVFARNEGSVAAPTAGLHFSKKILDELKEKSVQFASLSLDVGIGTFRPVKTEISEHKMHKERFQVSHYDLEILLKNVDKTFLVIGTTSLRVLESLYLYALKTFKGIDSRKTEIQISQWDHLEFKDNELFSRKKALLLLHDISLENNKSGFVGYTSLFILKSKPVIMADLLLTNFHQPSSTLLMLVDAFASVNWSEAYSFALDNNFRFLSYGDACIFANKFS